MRILLAAVAFTLFFSSGLFAAAKEKPKLNVVLIDVTSLRADHLSVFGYPYKTAPHLDRLAKESVVFSKAISQAHWTLPSVTSILTSLYVPSHGLDSREKGLDPEIPGLPAVFKENGFRTLAFVGGLDLAGKYGLNKYFDVYLDDHGPRPMGSLGESFSRALQWLRDNPKERFFMFIQGYDVHPPFGHSQAYRKRFGREYRGILAGHPLSYSLLKNVKEGVIHIGGKSTRLTEEDVNYVRAAYDAGIEQADRSLGEFLASLKKLGKMNDTIIVVLGDHGEELYDHGSFDRFGARNYFEEVLHVPLMIRHPFLKPALIRSQVELIDILPTILGSLGIVPKTHYILQGKDLNPMMIGQASPGFKRYVYSGGFDGRYAVRTEDWKLFFADGKFLLYDLSKDPGESRPVNNEKVEIELAQRLYDWYVGVSLNLFYKSKARALPLERLPKPYRDPDEIRLWYR